MKDIQEIVKKVADRYNVEYDPNLSGPKVRYKDGTIKSLDIYELEKLFSKPINDDKNWKQINSLQKNQLQKNRIELQGNNNEYSFEELIAMTY